MVAGAWSFSYKILYLANSFLVITTSISDPSQHSLRPGFKFWHIWYVDRHSQFARKVEIIFGK